MDSPEIASRTKRVGALLALMGCLALPSLGYAGGGHHHHHRHHHHPRVIVRPSIGVVVPVLPYAYGTIWYGGVPYYHASGIYYRRLPARRGYVVSEPPPERETAPAQSSARTDLFIYPKNGQSEAQQGKDRFECHRWATGETGFDPTESMGGVAESQAPAKRAEYLRAQQACLEARGYSVK